MRHLALVLLFVCIAAAQEAQRPPSAPPTEEQILHASRTAERDMQALQVYDAVGLNADEALRVLTLVRDYEPKGREFDARRARLIQGAAADLKAKQDALLRNRWPDAAVRLRLSVLDANLAQVDQDRQDAGTKLAADARAVLSPEHQRNVLDPGQTPPPLTADEANQRRRAEAEREQAIFVAYVRLITEGRRERDPRRFEALAPGACSQTAVAFTGLPSNDPSVVELTRFLVGRLTYAFQLRPAELRTEGNLAAIQMAQATMYVIGQTATGGGMRQGVVSAEAWEAALTYSRAAELLLQLAQFRVNPLANR
ncbi:MAG: hypothetical protein HYU66_14995 [Armatimonadetes bacterium]|nr:hypothetical protein [Armatimonadota bacterium]